MGMIISNPIPTATYKVLMNYTGSGFNAANSTASYETAVIAPVDMLNSNYVMIFLTVAAYQVSTTGSTTHSPSLKVETKSQGGAYSTDLNVAVIAANTPAGSHDIGVTDVKTISVCHQLTAAEKLNGLVIKITGTADQYASISNSSVFAISLS